LASAVHLRSYFERIGFSGSIAPTFATLQALHLLHPTAIAFENLSLLMGEPVPLDHESLAQKMLFNRRGGFCFEHNCLFMDILGELDFTVRAHAAHLLWNKPEGELPSASHMILTVEIGGVSYLCDVGFGGLTLTAPLKLKEGEQDTPHEKFALVHDGALWRLNAHLGNTWKPIYAFDLAEKSRDELHALSVQVSSNAASSLVTQLACARPDAEKGRHSLRDNRLTTYANGTIAEQKRLTSLEDMGNVLANIFGIALPPADRLDPILLPILAKDISE
jgi:N-hydroxyarylamine O-acetyltransferase